DLSLKNALDNLCLENAKWALEILNTIDSGGHAGELSASQEDALPEIIRKVQSERIRLKEILLKDLVEHLDITFSSYRDVLIRCSLSGRLAWLRVAHDAAEDGDLLDVASWATGRSVIVTNLKPLKNRYKIPTFMFGTHSTIQSLSSVAKPIPENQSPACAAEYDRTISHPIDRPKHLRYLFESLCNCACAQASLSSSSFISLSSQEVSFAASLLSWEERNVTVDSRSVVNDLIELELVLTDPSRVLVVLKYVVPALAKKSLKWLKKGSKIYVESAVAEQLDKFNEIVIMVKGDRTYIKPVEPLSSASRSKGLGPAQRRQSTGSSMVSSSSAFSGSSRRATLGPGLIGPGHSSRNHNTKLKRRGTIEPSQRNSDGSNF
ncbi:MAG: hypothetical protein VXZ58_07475, partial [Actinomycetota bacterium]|nr:hypothetical protein [Actinomycetota bacterium]